MFSSLEGIVLSEEISEVGGDFEFVGIRIGLFALAELLDFCASNFVVLLELAINQSAAAHVTVDGHWV